MIKNIIVAMANNNVIGLNNKMPWHIPEDLKYFKDLTMGFPVIMGRKTYESIGSPLKGRKNIIITSKKINGNVEVVNSIEDALEIAEKTGKEKCFIIGGASIYKQTIDLADNLYVTEILKDFSGDTFFPAINKKIWKKSISSEEKKDNISGLHYKFTIYSKN